MSRVPMRAAAAGALVLAFILVITLALTGWARAESLQYCRDYAAAAVIKADENLAFRCRYKGPRWATNYALHLNWCLAMPRPVTIRERMIRRRMIIACHG